MFNILMLLAHSGELVEEHPPQDTAALDPTIVILALVGIGAVGFLVWKFLLKK